VASRSELADPRSSDGLPEAEARRRLEARGAERRPATSRSYGSIVRANVFTLFNLVLLVFGAATLIYADWRDALFLGILVANTTIGIVQEVRAKHALDRLAALVAPTATVVRDGRPRRLPVGEVVIGDRVLVAPGDQLVADGRLASSAGLALDESILSGESNSVVRAVGDDVRSGSFVAEGDGAYVITAVGPESYAERIAGEARAFRHPRSPLELALNRLLIWLVVVMAPLGALLIASLWLRDRPIGSAVSTATAGAVSMVPEGLMLLASLTYAVAAIRLAGHGALAQQLNAIESLASADVICLDKTGTLTEAALRVVDHAPAPGVDPPELEAALARYAASSPTRNGTLDAIAAAHAAPAAEVGAHVPFASRRRWSALRVGADTDVLGAPELFDLDPALAERAGAEAAAGRRVVAIARTEAPLDDESADGRLPDGLRPLGLVVLSERLRADARETVGFFLAQGIELKVLSGDAPATVAAIARDAGIPAAGPPADGRELPDDPLELRELALRTSVVGRISPEGKRRVVEALRDAGRYVAMVGDGVNDVPALKAARLAIAQGTGAQMAKSVADVVLVRGDFAAVPKMVAEGRQVLRNVQRVAKLFVAKSVFAGFLILTIGTSSAAYPFLPRHLSLASSVAIGIPAFFLALAPSSGAWRPTGFLRDVVRFALPAGVAIGVGVLTGYLLARYGLDLSVRAARTVSTTVLVAAGLALVVVLEGSAGRRGAAVAAMCVALGGVYALALGLTWSRDFFQLAAPRPAVLLGSAVGTGTALVALRAGRALLHGRGRAATEQP